MSETNIDRAAKIVSAIQSDNKRIVAALELVIIALDEAEKRGRKEAEAELEELRAEIREHGQERDLLT